MQSDRSSINEPPRMTANVLAFSVDALLGQTGQKEIDRERKLSSTTIGEKSEDRFSSNVSNPPRSGHSTDDNIKVELCGKELWSEFHKLGNEMIITKAGRRMFPALKLKVSGLDPDAHYILWIDVVSLDDNRYRYVYPSSQWMIAGTGDPALPYSQYIHPDCPATGRQWMMQFISFDRLKLTNNKQPLIKGQVSLHSMHKYQPRLHILKTNDLHTEPDIQLDNKNALVVVFPETSFITVTAYQNQQITRLKIASNPFAKGFRETIKTREESDQFDHNRIMQFCRPRIEFPGVGPMVFSPNPIHPYPYILGGPEMYSPSYYPYYYLDGYSTINRFVAGESTSSSPTYIFSDRSKSVAGLNNTEVKITPATSSSVPVSPNSVISSDSRESETGQPSINANKCQFPTYYGLNLNNYPERL